MLALGALEGPGFGGGTDPSTEKLLEWTRDEGVEGDVGLLGAGLVDVVVVGGGLTSIACAASTVAVTVAGMSVGVPLDSGSPA